jgi:inhibitor of KinA sporulation pathway (predicted exonuclease)
MIRWAFDLELEQPSTNPQTLDSKLSEAKIIQIGVVFFNVITGQTIESKKWYINIGVPLSKFIKSLTNISQNDIDTGTTIENAYEELVYLIKKHKAFKQPVVWGSGDLLALKKEVVSKNIPWLLGSGEMNVKALYQLYAQLHGLKWRGGLETSMHRLGIKFQGRAHDALVDAENTKLMLLHLSKSFRGV